MAARDGLPAVVELPDAVAAVVAGIAAIETAATATAAIAG